MIYSIVFFLFYQSSIKGLSHVHERIGNSIPVSGSYMSKKTCTAAREIMVTCLFTQESTISAENAVSLTGQSHNISITCL